MQWPSQGSAVVLLGIIPIQGLFFCSNIPLKRKLECILDKFTLCTSRQMWRTPYYSINVHDPVIRLFSCNQSLTACIKCFDLAIQLKHYQGKCSLSFRLEHESHQSLLCNLSEFSIIQIQYIQCNPTSKNSRFSIQHRATKQNMVKAKEAHLMKLILQSALTLHTYLSWSIVLSCNLQWL